VIGAPEAIKAATTREPTRLNILFQASLVFQIMAFNRIAVYGHRGFVGSRVVESTVAIDSDTVEGHDLKDKRCLEKNVQPA
jgi:hypothetical protein